MPKDMNMVVADQLWRAYIVSEDTSKDAWTSKWSWILEEYEKLHEKLDEISKSAEFQKPPKDIRSLKPYPSSVNHEYGWVCAHPEFRLEKYGPDVMKPKPLPKDD